MSVAAILFATAESADATPAAALRCEESTVIGRLLAQLGALSRHRAAVITRPAWESDLRAAVAHSVVEVEVYTSTNVAEDLRKLTEIVGRSDQSVVIGSAEILTQQGVLAGLLADPRGVSCALASDRPSKEYAYRTRTERARVVSAESPYHQVRSPNSHFLAMMRINVSDRDTLIATASRMGELLEAPLPQALEQQYERTVASSPDVPHAASAVAAASADPLPFLLVGLVRARVRMMTSDVGELCWGRPLSQDAVTAELAEIAGCDEEKILLNAAVKDSDGFFTTFFVSPYSKFVARWFARKGWTPHAVTVLSMAMGIGTAVLFATGTRWGLISGAVMLQLAFMLDCVDGQLARYTRRFSRFGGWLDSVFDRGKEYVSYAGLAVGAAVGFDTDVWVLAVAVLGLQTVRHTIDFSFPSAPRRTSSGPPVLAFDVAADYPPEAARTEPATGWRGEQQTVDTGIGAPGSGTKGGFGYLAVRLSRWLGRRSWTYWLKKVVVLPIGERFALISLTAAVFTPRVTFVALLVWGGLALVYQLTGRVMRSLT